MNSFLLREDTAIRAQNTNTLDLSIWTILAAIIVKAMFLRTFSVMSNQAGIANLYLFTSGASSSLYTAELLEKTFVVFWNSASSNLF